ncbi:Histidine phosphatase superfamily (branch 1) [Tessaracoccus bendigoensis DSM 12906]|uniref:Histidine phosphatase superfamily (Branch 1) n=1 Tax=Tessaracoccus bendigoensis DSM 12906 TaxID=1123357 RepID=A0A1M6K9N0_9ACTN|nr:MSMEG_4193 family putative phosphomutase [Tessaracoccus bendigoensis]SHJ55688.1 Histidine phosphatase superfamily (branch 1) [Tessaracoccus bendigoensis DSM 12906]
MTKVVLIRHGRSTANADGVLAGRAPGVALDETGRAQATKLGRLLARAEIAAAFTSPVQRCRETATLAGFGAATVVEELSECDYGAWTGARLETLRGEHVWGDIQTAPSRVSFPGGESMQEMFARTSGAVRELAGRHADAETIVVFSHGDPIKAILADAFGMRLDDFQRLHVSPAGVSIVEYHGERPLVVCVNVVGDLASLLGSTIAPMVGGGDVANPRRLPA